MSKKILNVDWRGIAGAAVKKRILKLKRNDEGLFPCPVSSCLHLGFKSDRGARKHVNTVHPWYLYFDQQPPIDRKEIVSKDMDKRKNTTHNKPAYSLKEGMGKEFLDWLKTPCGGGKSGKQAIQSGRRAMKFLMASLGDTEVDKHVSEEFIDCCLGSPSIVINFFKVVTEDWKISSSAALNYMKSISDLMDWRKANGVTDDVLRSFTVTEVYIRRGKENLSKQKILEYGRNLDLEQLICRKSWASVEEMEQVIPYHTPRYKYVLDLCKEENSSPSVSQLAFATRFIATFLFLRVKCTRPMTYQYITLKMIEEAKSNGGYIDQTTFKTERQYAFDTLILSTEVMQIIDTYVSFIRPKLKPSCNYLLLTTNGKQYSALGSAMSILVHQAIEKYVNPTRYRQIIESQSAERLTPEEMDTISRDQCHSSYVAKRIYQKKLSRDVALKGKLCMEKITGTQRDEHTKDMASILSNEMTESSALSDQVTERTDSHVEETSTVQSNDVEEILSVMSVPGRDTIKEDEDCCKDPISTDTVTDNLKSVSINSDNDESGDKSGEEDFAAPLASNNKIDHSPHNTAARTSEEPDMPTYSNVSDESEVEDCAPAIKSVKKIDHSQRNIHARRSNRSDMPVCRNLSVEVKKEVVENEMERAQLQKRFCSDEDAALKEGIKKYGLGKWSIMLKDKTLNFHPNRTRDSIRVRADTLGLSKKKKKKKTGQKSSF